MAGQLEKSASSKVRFRPHIEAGLKISRDLNKTNRSIEAKCCERLNQISAEKRDADFKIQKLKNHLNIFNAEIKDEIGDLQVELDQVPIAKTNYPQPSAKLPFCSV